MVDNDGHIPVLSVGSIRSIVTIKPPSSNPISLHSDFVGKNHGALAVSRLSSASPSVATASYYLDKFDRKESENSTEGRRRISLVATCTSAKRDAQSDNKNTSYGGRISLATIVDSPLQNDGGCKVVGMQYSATTNESSTLPCFRTVCIATTMQQYSILLAIGDSRLYYCPIKHYDGKSRDDDEDRSLNMQECHFDSTTCRDTPKKGKKAKSKNSNACAGEDNALPSLSMINTLSAESVIKQSAIERTMEDIDKPTPVDSEQISPANYPTKASPATKEKVSRKRKHSPTKQSTASNTNGTDTTTNTESICVIASNLNDTILPSSQSPPIVMILSSSDVSNQQLVGSAWSTVPGLENVDVPMTSILFVSKFKCGSKVWDGIIPTISGDLDKRECDEGVVLMGFLDGSLRASLVECKSDDGATKSTTLDISNATTILQLGCNEPIISLQLLPAPSDVSFTSTPLLICVGALGTIISFGKTTHANSPKFLIERRLSICGGRWASLTCVGYQLVDNAENTTELHFVGVNDSKQTYLHSVHIAGKSGTSAESESYVCGLPIPTRMISSIYGFSGNLIASSDYATLTLSFSSGKVVVMRVPLNKQHASDDDCGAASSLLALLKCRNSSPNENKTIDRGLKSEPSMIQSLLQKLKLASTAQNKSETQKLCDSINRQTKHSMDEIRDVTQVAAFSCKDTLSPMQCEAERLEPGVLTCIIKAEQLPQTRQSATSWNHSVHILQSCPQTLSPLLRPQSNNTCLCCRRNSAHKATAVLYGGTATSYSGEIKSINVSMNDFIPVSAYASLSMVYTDGMHGMKCWQKSSNLASEGGAAKPQLLSLSGLAKRSGLENDDFLGISLPFNIGSKTNNTSNLTLDILSHLSGSEDKSTITPVGDASNLRDTAEKCVLQWCQSRQSSQANSHDKFVLPVIKEQQLIRRHSMSKSRGTEDIKVHCCSSSLRIQNHVLPKTCMNVGVGPVSIVSKGGTDTDTTPEQEPDELAFAIASSLITPNQTMSMIPLIRQALIRRSLEQGIHSQTKEHLKVLTTYQMLLAQKKTAKVARHVIKSSDDLLAKTEQTQERSCPNELLTAAVSLYDIIRTLQILHL